MTKEVRDLLIPDKGWIRRYVDAYSQKYEVPDEAIAGMAYSLLSATVGWRAYLGFTDAREPLSLFTLLVGESASAKKTTTLNIGEAIAADANRQYVKRRGLSDLDEIRPTLKVLQGGHVSNRGLANTVGTDNEDKLVEYDRSIPPSYLMTWDEIAPLITEGAEGSFLNETRFWLLKMYGGRQPGVTTADTQLYPIRTSLSVVGTMTANQFNEMLSGGSVQGGTLGRMMVIPTGDPDAWVPLPIQVDQEQRDELVNWLSDFCFMCDRFNNDECLGQVTFTNDAREFWLAWYTAHKDNIKALDQEDSTRAEVRSTVFGRYQATALKLAALLELSLWDGNIDSPPKPEITMWSLMKATRFVEWSLEHVVPIAADAIGTKESRFERRVIAFLEKQPDRMASLTDIRRRVRLVGLEGDRLRKYLDHLADEDIIEIKQRTRETKTGPRQTLYYRLLED